MLYENQKLVFNVTVSFQYTLVRHQSLGNCLLQTTNYNILATHMYIHIYIYSDKGFSTIIDIEILNAEKYILSQV